MADLTHTHALTYEGGRVVKRYVEPKPGAAEREWRALTVLAEHTPGLAPEPIAYEDGVVTMSRLDGVPLRGMGGAQVRRVAAQGRSGGPGRQGGPALAGEPDARRAGRHARVQHG
ncbi:hypothetical protein ACFMQL_17990 [Nonomuraea fastidiosa]|jgi:hypothetical protein|uniref:hypothetical protein n=1 Tax=Nonomuraea TaxID=83681 RepID=UPI00324AEF1D